MSLFHRAFLYVTRKSARSGILFLILLVIATLTLSGMAIRSATQTAQLNVRQALGGVFTLEQNTSDASKWASRSVGSYGSQSWYTGAQLTEEIADAIVEAVPGIRGYNATCTNYVIAADASGKTLELLESGDDDGFSSLLSGYGDFASTVAAYGSTDTAFDSYFTGGYLELVAGRHVTSADQNAVLISQELAEQNGLQVGDHLMLHMSEFKASMMNIDVADTRMEVEIVGLFHATAKSTTTLSNWSMDNSLYTTLNVIQHVRPDTPDEGYEKIQFYVDDPAELDGIVSRIQALPDIDPTDFVVRVDSSGVDAVTEPLSNMNRLVSVLIVLALAVGAAVLYLVLSSRIRERVHESGVLLSLGLSRGNIAAQYLVEVLMIALVAFSVSIFSSGFIARSVGSQLLDYTLADSAEEADEAGTTIDGMTFSSSSDYAPKFESAGGMTKIDVRIERPEIVGLYGVGALIICVAVCMAALPVLRMKPREILSKMS